GDAIPTDHAYPLYAALSRLVPAFHDKNTSLRFLPLSGVPAGRRQLQLTDRSRLRVRLPDDSLRLALPLAGKQLDIAGSSVRLGVPSVSTLVPAPTLFSRIVTLKLSWQSPRERKHARPNLADLPTKLQDASTPDKFLTAVRHRL